MLAASRAIEGSSSSGVDRVAAAGQSWPVARRLGLWRQLSLDLLAWVIREYDGECRLSGQFRVLLYIIYETSPLPGTLTQLASSESQTKKV